MSLSESTAIVQKQQIEKKLGVKVVDTKLVKITKRIYPCRPQVLERKEWIKFGEVKDIPRGQHKKGDFTQNQKVQFKKDDQDGDGQIELVEQIKNISKQSMMNKRT